MMLYSFIFSAVLPYVTAESCFYQRCLTCHPQEIISPGSSVNCHPSNWVSPQWVHNYGHPPPTTDSKVPIEYRCLKMVATPDNKSYGNTVDVVKGCVPRAQIDSVCNGLVSVERARGHSDARCHICRGNDCNSASSLRMLYALLTTLLLYFVLR